MTGNSYITPKQRERLTLLRQLAGEGYTRSQAIAASGCNESGFRALLARYCGSSVWPARIPDAVFSLPVADGRSSMFRAPRASPRTLPEPLGMDDSLLAARIAADQAAIHGPRIAALFEEQQRYNLPRMGKLVDWMAA